MSRLLYQYFRLGSGIESVLAGLRATISDDDQLLAAACAIFNGLMAHFQHDPNLAIKEAPL